jgi:hypothetical protein
MQTKIELAPSKIPFLPFSFDSHDGRRLWQRHPFGGRLRVLEPSTQQLKGIGRLVNLSGGGVGFSTAIDMPVYKFLLLEFELDGNSMRVPVCIMQRSSDKLYGAEFLLLPEATRSRIDSYLAQHAAVSKVE